MRVASPFYFYDNLANGVRIDSVEDLRKVVQSVELNTPEGFGFAMAVIVTSLYVDWGFFSWFISEFTRQVQSRTNLSRVEVEEGRAMLYSEAVLGTLVLDASKPPCTNLLYFALAVFGEDAMKYRATRVAFHYLEVLVMKFTAIKDAMLGSLNGRTTNGEA